MNVPLNDPPQRAKMWNYIRDARGHGRGSERQSHKGYTWEVPCPNHDDQNPSLGVTLTPEGKLLVHCARCDTPTVIGQWGMTERDLAPPQEPSTNSQHPPPVYRY